MSKEGLTLKSSEPAFCVFLVVKLSTRNGVGNSNYLLIDECFNYSHSVSQSVSPRDKSREKHLTKYFDQNDESRHSYQAQSSITYYLRRAEVGVL
jgi:hypothetical protein